MAKPRISVRRIKEVLRLSSQCSLSRRQVAHSSKVSRSTVSDYLWRAEKAGIGWPLPEHLTNQVLQHKLFPRIKPLSHRWLDRCRTLLTWTTSYGATGMSISR